MRTVPVVQRPRLLAVFSTDRGYRFDESVDRDVSYARFYDDLGGDFFGRGRDDADDCRLSPHSLRDRTCRGAEERENYELGRKAELHPSAFLVAIAPGSPSICRNPKLSL